jgi:hypothetical protein
MIIVAETIALLALAYCLFGFLMMAGMCDGAVGRVAEGIVTVAVVTFRIAVLLAIPVGFVLLLVDLVHRVT